MNLFEFKTADAHFHVDLEHIQLIDALRYREEPYVADWGFGPGSGGIAYGRSHGEFSITLFLRDEPRIVKHRGEQQPKEYQLQQDLMTKLNLGVPSSHVEGDRPPYRELKGHSPDVKTLAAALNEVPNPFEPGRAFKAEYERLLAAWRAAKRLLPA